MIDKANLSAYFSHCVKSSSFWYWNSSISLALDQMLYCALLMRSFNSLINNSEFEPWIILTWPYEFRFHYVVISVFTLFGGRCLPGFWNLGLWLICKTSSLGSLRLRNGHRILGWYSSKDYAKYLNIYFDHFFTKASSQILTKSKKSKI